MQRTVTQLDVAAEGDRSTSRTVDEPGEQGGGDVIGRCGGEHGAGDHRRHERARRDSSAELLDDDDQLLEPVAGASVLFGHVKAEPAELGGVGVERGVLLGGGLEQRPCRCPSLALGQEVADGVGERAVVLRDGDRHGPNSTGRRPTTADRAPRLPVRTPRWPYPRSRRDRTLDHVRNRKRAQVPSRPRPDAARRSPNSVKRPDLGQGGVVPATSSREPGDGHPRATRAAEQGVRPGD